jgi:hypothetical protein
MTDYAPRHARALVSMLAKITRLERLGASKLRVAFNDGSKGTHDFVALANESAASPE